MAAVIPGKCSFSFSTFNFIYHTTDRDGLTELNPAPTRMRALLRSLSDADASDAAPEVWLSHLETGWTLYVFPHGLLQLEADDKKQPLREMNNSDLDDILELWTILAEGDIKRLLRANWREVER